MSNHSIATPVAPIVSIIDGQAVTTSLEIARVFEKNHKDVLRAIAQLRAECDDEFAERNFALMSLDIDVGNGATRKSPTYHLTRDGFTLLAMGFTVPAVAIEASVPGGLMREAARMGLAISLLAGPLAVLLAQPGRRRPPG